MWTYVDCYHVPWLNMITTQLGMLCSMYMYHVPSIMYSTAGWGLAYVIVWKCNEPNIS